jgi:hypothetical protein
VNGVIKSAVAPDVIPGRVDVEKDKPGGAIGKGGVQQREGPFVVTQPGVRARRVQRRDVSARGVTPGHLRKFPPGQKAIDGATAVVSMRILDDRRQLVVSNRGGCTTPRVDGVVEPALYPPGLCLAQIRAWIIRRLGDDRGLPFLGVGQLAHGGQDVSLPNRQHRAQWVDHARGPRQRQRLLVAAQCPLLQDVRGEQFSLQFVGAS